MTSTWRTSNMGLNLDLSQTRSTRVCCWPNPLQSGSASFLLSFHFVTTHFYCWCRRLMRIFGIAMMESSIHITVDGFKIHWRFSSQGFQDLRTIFEQGWQRTHPPSTPRSLCNLFWVQIWLKQALTWRWGGKGRLSLQRSSKIYRTR